MNLDIEDVFIGAPCNYGWENMAGDSRKRLCGGCDKAVYNLAAMPRAQAQELLDEKGDSVCLRITRDLKGELVTRETRLQVMLLSKFRQVVFTLLSLIFFVPQVLAKGSDSVTSQEKELPGGTKKGKAPIDWRQFDLQPAVYDGMPCVTVSRDQSYHGDRNKKLDKVDKSLEKLIELNPSWLNLTKSDGKYNKQGMSADNRVFSLYRQAKKAEALGNCTEAHDRYREALQLAREKKHDPKFIELIKSDYQNLIKVHNSGKEHYHLNRSKYFRHRLSSPTLPEGAPIPEFK